MSEWRLPGDKNPLGLLIALIVIVIVVAFSAYWTYRTLTPYPG